MALLLPLLGAPLLTARAYRAAEDWQRGQIALDNGAITVGRADRETLKAVEAANQLLRALELVHHGLHACARVPQTAAVCRPKDLAMEAKIVATHTLAGQAAQVSWSAALPRALAEMGRLKVMPKNIRRGARAPIESHRCPLCRLSNRWDVLDGDRLVTAFALSKPRPLFSGVRAVREGKSWQYELLAEEGGTR